MNKQQLASKIWASANKMRSKIEANDYKDYILGFIFYKYLSDKEEAFLKKNDWTESDFKDLIDEDLETVRFCQEGLGYFIAYDNLFSTWLKKGSDFNVSDVRDALSAFSRLISDTHKKVFDKIFDTLQTGISKLGESAGSQTKAINDLIQLIKAIPTTENQDYDVLGFIYEYLISNFAANAGKKAGEFYTPHEVSVLMSEIIADHLKYRQKIEIYDPTSGSGSLLINIGRSVAKYISGKDSIKYYAQELKENTFNLTRMNLVMRNIDPANIMVRNADTLEDDWPYFDDNNKEATYHPLYVDAVVSNPPYSQAWDPTNKDADPRYSRYGIAPKGKADYAFLLHDLYHVKPDGIMTIVLPHGVLFRGGEEERIRKNLIEENNIDAIIGLPSDIFFGTGIPTIIIVLKQHRANDDVLIVDASKGFVKEGKNNKLRASDIRKITDAIVQRTDLEKFSRKVSRQEIRDNNYNLNIPRYVDSSDDAEQWDIYASMFGGIPNSEIDALSEYWQAFPSLRSQIFHCDGTPYSNLCAKDIRQSIVDNADVNRFVNNFTQSFASFPQMLIDELIGKMLTLPVAQEEKRISDDIFDRLHTIPLVDKYEAYQLLDNQWTGIQTDLEVIQTEGFDATRKVEPNMVLTKIKGKEVEVQKGWLGRVIPFELVQKTLLLEQANEVKALETALAAVTSEKDCLLEKLKELGEGDSLLNDDKTAFSAADVAKEAKALAKTKAKYAHDTLEHIVLTANKVLEQEKKLKKDIKQKADDLHALTKTVIKSLPDEDVHFLLTQKWITPLQVSLADLPNKCINKLVTQIKALANKYALTYTQLDQEIREAEKELSALIDQLEGDDFDMKGLHEFQKLLGGNNND